MKALRLSFKNTVFPLCFIFHYFPLRRLPLPATKLSDPGSIILPYDPVEDLCFRMTYWVKLRRLRTFITVAIFRGLMRDREGLGGCKAL